MKMSVAKEYQMLIDKKQNMEAELLSLPSGYISRKAIKGNVQYYLQKREGTRVIGTYIRNEDIHDVSAKIERRKAIIRELSEIDARMAQLEQAAKLIDRDLYCHLAVYKLSSGMDSLDSREKDICLSFGSTMNAVEGVPVSKETSAEIAAWKNGGKSFLLVFESTLRRYGFPVEEMQ